MKIQESPYGCSESYAVKFWYENEEGFSRQEDETLYCNSKSAHKAIETYFKKHIAKNYKYARIISVTYQ